MDKRRRRALTVFTEDELRELEQADAEIEREFERDPLGFAIKNRPYVTYNSDGTKRKHSPRRNGRYTVYHNGELVSRDANLIDIARYLNVTKAQAYRIGHGINRPPSGYTITYNEE